MIGISLSYHGHVKEEFSRNLSRTQLLPGAKAIIFSDRGGTGQYSCKICNCCRIVEDCKDVLRIPEDFNTLDSDSDQFFVEVNAIMEEEQNGQCIHLFKQLCCRTWSEVFLRLLGEKKKVFFKDAVKYNNHLFCTSDISDRIFSLLFITPVYNKNNEIKENMKKKENDKTLCKCSMLRSCWDDGVHSI